MKQQLLQIKHWFTIEGDRRIVSAVVFLIVFVVTLLFGAAWGAQRFMFGGVSTATALLYLLTAIVTLTTVVLSINQLVLSYSLGPIEKQQQALEDTLSYRERVSELAGAEELSERPTEVINTLLDEIRREAKQCHAHASTASSMDEDIRNQLTLFLDELEQDIPDTQQGLEETQFRQLPFVSRAEAFDATDRLATLRSLRRAIQDPPRSVEQHLQPLEDSLELLVIGTEHFKMSYLQSQFIEFSRSLLYVALPALLITFYATQVLGQNAFQGAFLGIPHSLWAASSGVTIAVTPFIVMISYAFRLATLSRLTVFTGPFKHRTPIDRSNG